MLKNNGMNSSDFEKILKEKIDEMASSVDCFDKISKRAFPDKAADLTDNEYTVCELENVTGKKRGFRFLPAALAVTAAAAVCIAVIPKNSFVSQFLANIGGSSKKIYREVMDEINRETADGSYTSFDISLSDYISNDVLVTPLARCPFEKSDKDGVMVRVFVKTFNGIPTNQMYAVEYEGSYDDGNFIAAADSRASFSDEELQEKCSDASFPDVRHDAFEFVEKYFAGSGGDVPYFLAGSDKVNVSSFSYNCIFKYDTLIFPVSSEIIMYSVTNSPYKYRYDFISQTYGDSNAETDFDTTAFGDAWDNVVYFSGSSARAEDNASAFTRAGFVKGIKLDGSLDNSVSYTDILLSEYYSDAFGTVVLSNRYGTNTSAPSVPSYAYISISPVRSYFPHTDYPVKYQSNIGNKNIKSVSPSDSSDIDTAQKTADFNAEELEREAAALRAQIRELRESGYDDSSEMKLYQEQLSEVQKQIEMIQNIN